MDNPKRRRHRYAEDSSFSRNHGSFEDTNEPPEEDFWTDRSFFAVDSQWQFPKSIRDSVTKAQNKAGEIMALNPQKASVSGRP